MADEKGKTMRIMTLTKKDGVWVLTVISPSGRVQEYRCASPTQAQQFASLLVPNETPVEA